jgi:hypothetical protein
VGLVGQLVSGSGWVNGFGLFLPPIHDPCSLPINKIELDLEKKKKKKKKKKSKPNYKLTKVYF